MISLKLIVVLLLVCAISQLTSTKKTEILDKEGNTSSIESIAQAVCDITRGADKQISQYSTIARLIQFFQSISSDHQLAACAQQSLPALEQMQLILTIGSVCSEAKLDLIEKFHRNFISKVRKYRKEQKANNLSAPKLLKLFYMHYVSAVSATCERVASRQLETITFNKEAENEEADIALNQVGGLFGKIDSRRGYKDMFVLWNFIDSLPVEKDAKLSRYLHQGKTRLLLQMHKVDSLAKIQEGCHKLKPSYSSALFPVIRLADLGFYPTNDQLASMLGSNPDYSHLYTVTQLCETLLRIQAVPNDNLKSNQIVVLSKDDASSLNLNEETQEQPSGSSLELGSESLESVEFDDTQTYIKKVKSNVDSRVIEQNKILRRLLRRFKGESNKEEGQFILSNGSIKEDLESILHESLPTIDESDTLGPVEGDEDGDEEVVDVVVRKRRGVMKYVKKALQSVLLGFLVLVHFSLFLVLYLVQSFILLPVLAVLALWITFFDCPEGKFTRLIESAVFYKLPNFPVMVYDKFHEQKLETHLE